MNISDRLCNAIMQKKSPIVVGIDPVISRIPLTYFDQADRGSSELDHIANGIIGFSKDVIDAVCDDVPAVKPQIAFFEMYGSVGIRAFEAVVQHARAKGLVVIEDAKRNDIGNTASAYAAGHLGEVELLNSVTQPVFDVDFLTVSSFLGSESLVPFVETCVAHNKGIFILVKTSNASAGEVQDAIVDGQTVSQCIAAFIETNSERFVGNLGYSSIGAVVGATYPQDAEMLRKAMPKSIFLVPGYGAQGGTANDVVSSFNPDGLGAIVNASRSILYGYEDQFTRSECTRHEYMDTASALTMQMKTAIYGALRLNYPNMVY